MTESWGVTDLLQCFEKEIDSFLPQEDECHDPPWKDLHVYCNYWLVLHPHEARPLRDAAAP
eukprot:scaffold8390_cov84-Amphora_coffeaeformis.AAC.1